MEDELEPVQFITSEIEDDFILSFYVASPHDPGLGRSIILMRDKKWEHLVAESEKGVKVFDEDFSEVEEADDDYLTEIHIGNTVAEIKTTHCRYNLDLRHVDKSEISEARKILENMNYDRRFKFSIG
jgi:hypothetical protein